MKYESLQLKINEEEKQMQLEVEGYTAYIEFQWAGKNLILIHTEVPRELEGKGVGGAIVQKTLQYAKDNNIKVVPLCPFVQSYIKRHPDWNGIVL